MTNGQAGQARQRETVPQLTSHQEAARKWLQLVGQVRANKALKQRLIETPIAVLQEHGIKVREGLDIHVVEETDTVRYLTIPCESQITDEDLDAVVGGSPVNVVVGAVVGAAGSAIGAILDGYDALNHTFEPLPSTKSP